MTAADRPGTSEAGPVFALADAVGCVTGSLSAEPRSASVLRHEIVALARRHGAGDEIAAAVAIAVVEAANNVIHHAYGDGGRAAASCSSPPTCPATTCRS